MLIFLVMFVAPPPKMVNFLLLAVFVFAERAGWAPLSAREEAPKSSKKNIVASKKITGHGVKGPACGCYACVGDATSLFFLSAMSLKKSIKKVCLVIFLPVITLIVTAGILKTWILGTWETTFF